MNIRLKKLNPEAIIPTYGTPGAAGFDLYAVEDVMIFPGQSKLIKTGIAVEIPVGFELQVRPRSGTSLKTLLRVANSPGTIDSDYRGEVAVIGWNAGITTMNDKCDEVISIKKGDRIAQGVIAPVIMALFEVVDELSDTSRGSGGFGSTGK